MSAIDKIMKSIHENEKTFDDIPLAADVRTQSKVFDKEYHNEATIKADLFEKISAAIRQKADYVFTWWISSYDDEDTIKFYIEKLIPVLQEKGYNIIMSQYLYRDRLEYDFYIIWNNYDYYSNNITSKEELKGHKITVFESKVKE